MTRVLVAGVVLLAALASGDALRDAVSGGSAIAVGESERAPDSAPIGGARVRAAVLVPPRETQLRTTGGLIQTRVVAGSREVLGEEEIARAFPASLPGPTEIVEFALAPDGSLVLALRRFPAAHRLLGAIEVWELERTRPTTRPTWRLRAAWPVAPRQFAGGLGFVSPDDRLALFGADGSITAVYPLDGMPAELG
jgi:hypothetical protein